MGFSVSPVFLLLITAFGVFTLPISAADNTNLVFKGCAKQNFPDPPGIYTQNLKNLMQTLVSQSSQKSFSATTSGDGQNAITGLYQCRGDLSNPECYSCVSAIPDKVKKLCGEVIAARVQLNGCYLSYEVAGLRQEEGTQFLYKVCGSIEASGSGFQEMRSAAFDAMVGGVKNGFYTGNYRTVFVLGQCEGDLSSGDCSSCLKRGIESVKNKCGASISGQVYLQKCFISYSFYPNGVPTINSKSGVGTKNHTERTVAIAVGGVAAFGFLVVCLMFIRSLLKRRKSNKYQTWN